MGRYEILVSNIKSNKHHTHIYIYKYIYTLQTEFINLTVNSITIISLISGYDILWYIKSGNWSLSEKSWV